MKENKMRRTEVTLWSKQEMMRPLDKRFVLEVCFEDKVTCFPHLNTNLESAKEITRFSISGRTNYTAGQNVDEFLEMFPNDEDVKQLVQIWNYWHLNDIVAGTEAQMEVVKKANIGRVESWYDTACDELKKVGLYEDRGYTFGQHWLIRALPEGLEGEVNELMNRLSERYSKN